MTTARAFRDHSKAFVNLSIYEQRLHRTIKEAFRQLKELQTERREREENETSAREQITPKNQEAKHWEATNPETPAVDNIAPTKDLPTPPTGNGFVYASAEIIADGSGASQQTDRSAPSHP
jgi:septal ring factor EnvC (AmiA/AmiB activator)